MPFVHCAVCGELHVTSQRRPLLSALHELTPSPDDVVELVVVDVPPTLVELVVEFVTFDELLEFTEFVTLVALRASVVGRFPAGPQAYSASARTVARCLIVVRSEEFVARSSSSRFHAGHDPCTGIGVESRTEKP
jgi:hypothetical protein